MRTLKIGDDGDLEFSGGSPRFIERDDATAQRVRSRVRLILGEAFLANDKGLDWDLLFTKNPQLGLIEADIRAQVEDLDEVLSVTDFVIELNNAERTADISFTVTTATGELTIEETL